MTTAKRPLRILIADDHPIVLRGLVSVFQSQSDFQVVAACQDGSAALSAIRNHVPDIAILDFRMPKLSGLEVLDKIVEEKLPTKIAFLTASAGADYVLPYVNRMSRLRGDGPGFVRDLARVCEAVGLGTEVLAASIKSPEEAVQTLLAGAQHVSMPWAVLQAMGHDPLSEEAVADFRRASSSG